MAVQKHFTDRKRGTLCASICHIEFSLLLTDANVIIVIHPFGSSRAPRVIRPPWAATRRDEKDGAKFIRDEKTEDALPHSFKNGAAASARLTQHFILFIVVVFFFAYFGFITFLKDRNYFYLLAFAPHRMNFK